jgi:hypothetical protein
MSRLPFAGSGQEAAVDRATEGGTARLPNVLGLSFADALRDKKPRPAKTFKTRLKPEPFLLKPQKRFGTPRVSVVLEAKSGAARKGRPPACGGASAEDWSGAKRYLRPW